MTDDLNLSPIMWQACAFLFVLVLSCLIMSVWRHSGTWELLEEARREVNSAERQCVRLEKAIDDVAAENKRLSDESNAVHERQVQQYGQQLQEAKNSTANLENSCRLRGIELVELRKTCAEQEDMLERSRRNGDAHINELTKQLQEISIEKNTLNARNENLRAAAEESKADLESLRGCHQSLLQERDKLERLIAQLRDELADKLSAPYEQMVEAVNSAKADLEKSQRHEAELMKVLRHVLGDMDISLVTVPYKQLGDLLMESEKMRDEANASEAQLAKANETLCSHNQELSKQLIQAENELRAETTKTALVLGEKSNLLKHDQALYAKLSLIREAMTELVSGDWHPY